jgi:hypothetical protein
MPAQAKTKTLSQIYPTQKEAGEVAQVVEYLPNKGEALSSNPKTKKKKNFKFRKVAGNSQCTKISCASIQ